MPTDPLAYFITFSTYGAWLHGKEAGSVDLDHNERGTAYLPADPHLEAADRAAMAQPPFRLDAPRRRVVLATVREVCRHRGWQLIACHVRTTHVHIVVYADAPPEKVMNDCKANASRRLTEAGLDDKVRRRWTRHGSTQYIWRANALVDVVDYVLHRQGEPMETYQDTEASEPRPSGSGDAVPSEPRASGSGDAVPSEPRALASGDAPPVR